MYGLHVVVFSSSFFSVLFVVKMAYYLSDILGSMLARPLTHLNPNEVKRLPSPEELKGYVI